MHKISDGTKFKELPIFVKDHLSPPSILGLKSSIFLMTFILLDFICFFPIVADPFIDTLFWIVLPVILFVNGWAVFLFVRNVFSIQLESVLFLGIFSFAASFVSFVSIQKFAYYLIEIDSILFFMGSLFIVTVTTVYFIFYYNHKISQHDPHQKDEKKLWSGVFSLPALGYLFYHTVMKDSPFLFHFLIVLYFFITSFFIYLSVKFIHKFLFMKMNPQFINYHLPTKSERKQYRDQGKTIHIK